jgi:hypothetical protein
MLSMVPLFLDTDPNGKTSASSPQDHRDTGRGNVRAIIGKGPGALVNQGE